MTTSNNQPKLFISFTGVLAHMRRGEVTAADLQDGLFCFGCTREHALTPGDSGEFVEYDVEDHPNLHKQLVEALLKAEQAGRVRWRTIDKHTSFDLVNELLTANGYKPLMSAEDYVKGCPFLCGHSYNYPAVKERSTQLEVVW